MKIFVTKKDIQNGEKLSFTNCPIALSLKRRKVYFEEINKGAIITDESEEIPLPKKALNFINNFDSGNRVKPFAFKVKI
jgi:hypothetical protein